MELDLGMILRWVTSGYYSITSTKQYASALSCQWQRSKRKYCCRRITKKYKSVKPTMLVGKADYVSRHGPLPFISLFEGKFHPIVVSVLDILFLI